jgi:penicillin-binding protein A
MRRFVRSIALVASAGLIAYGVTRPPDRAGDVRWLICLWAAAPLLLLAALGGPRQGARGIANNIRNLGQIVGLGFALLALMLLRLQVVEAQNIYTKVVTDPVSGEVTSNIRPVLGSMRIQRGAIFDAAGQPLVASEVREGGFVHRVYPLAQQYNPAAFSNVVGFYSTRFGLAGLELTFDDYLSGARGAPPGARIEQALFGRPQVGNNLQLTLNAQLQAEVYELMAGRSGSAVVLDPRSGAIKALVSFPGYDPQHLAFDPAAEDWNVENDAISTYWREITADNAGEPLLNRATQGLYPPGSTFKTVTAVGALEFPDQGRPDDITCPNNYDAGYPQAPPVVNSVENLASLTGNPSNLERVYAYSCNTAFAQYAVRLGEGEFSAIAERFGVYRPENVAAQTPSLSDLDANISRLFVDVGFLQNPRALADSGYGQGQLLVSPLQMALVAAAVANDGLIMQPYLVERITTPDGAEVYTRGQRELGRAMSERNAQIMRRNMEAVVRYGFGQPAAVPGVSVGGKSGTAEHRPGATPHAWYIAVAPLDAPRFAVAVMVESGGEGSTVGAELAGRVMEAALRLEGGP